VEDVNGLVKRATELIKDRTLQQRFREIGLKTIKQYDWGILAKEYYKHLYTPLILQLSSKRNINEE